MEARRTPLYPVYTAAGARVAAYAGWELPIQFAGIGSEHRAVRTAAGLFDVSHMGEIRVTGRDALAFLQHLATNDCGGLTPGRVLYSLLCYPDGGCVDDLLIYMLDSDAYLLVVNAVNTAKDLAWLYANTGDYDVSVDDISEDYAQLALQGPCAARILMRLAGEAPLALKRYSFLPRIAVAGRSCLVSRTGYTGEDGFELYVAPRDAVPLWEAMRAEDRVVPAGLGARDTLRLEAGMPLYGHELSPSISPLEAGLSRFVALRKGSFLGDRALQGQAASGLARRLVGLELETRGVPRAECPVTARGRQVGAVTSGTLSPLTNRPIAMALLEAEAAAGTEPLAVKIRDKELPARRVPLPFYQRGRA